MASSRGGLHWHTQASRPANLTANNLGDHLVHGRDSQGTRADDQCVTGQWIKDSNLRWWRCSRELKFG